MARAAEHNLDPALVASIIYTESKFDSDSRSSAGAVGLMQLMPETAGWISRELGQPELRDQIADPGANVAMGTWYFRYLLDKYGDDRLALAAYNGGENNLNDWMRDNPDGEPNTLIGRIPFAETRVFVLKVTRDRIVYHWLYPTLR